MKMLLSRVKCLRLAVLCLLLTVPAAFSPAATASSALGLEISLEPLPQLTKTFLGFYTVQFELSINVKVRNVGPTTFQGGNLTIRIVPPSEKWESSVELRIPKLSPSNISSTTISFQPLEGGVYTIKVIDLHYDSGQILGHELGGFLAVYVSPTEFLWPLFLSIFSTLISLCSIVISVSNNQRIRRIES